LKIFENKITGSREEAGRMMLRWILEKYVLMIASGWCTLASAKMELWVLY
jgi:hypothetical protein